MILAVIDTNVLVSGLLSPRGNEALIILALHQRLVRPCLTEDILQEYASVLARAKFAFPMDEISALLTMLKANGEVLRPQSRTFTSPDPSDTKFLRCAQAAGADFIGTGNKRHFPHTPYGSIHVVNAAELLDRITLEI